MNQLEILIYVSLISADSEILTEEEKQAVMSRYDEIDPPKNWGYILQPIKDEDKRNKFIELMESAQQEEIRQEIEESKFNDIEPVDMEVLKD